MKQLLKYIIMCASFLGGYQTCKVQIDMQTERDNADRHIGPSRGTAQLEAAPGFSLLGG
jgi:hypothetical protein